MIFAPIRAEKTNMTGGGEENKEKGESKSSRVVVSYKKTSNFSPYKRVVFFLTGKKKLVYSIILLAVLWIYHLIIQSILY